MQGAVFAGDRHTGHPAVRGSHGVIAKILLEGVGESGLRGEVGGEVVHHRHVGEVEAARCAGVDVMVVHREMAVTVGVGA